MEEVRRVQVTGGSTYIVSLPKWWVRDMNIRQGDLLQFVLQPDSSLLIVPKTIVKEKEKKTSYINASLAESIEDVGRLFIASYLAGYDFIHVKFGKGMSGVRSHLKDIIRKKLVGVEITEESSEHLVGQCLLGHVEFPLKTAISRMHVLSISMHRDALKALRDRDLALVEDILQRDDDVDRLYFYVVRQLKAAVANRPLIEEIGLREPRDCLGYRLVAKSLERIADHAIRMARAIKMIQIQPPKDLIELIVEIGSVAISACEDAMRALSKVDMKLAQKSISLAQEVGTFEEKLTRKILESDLDAQTIMGLKLIIESIRRMAEYGADIAEVVINLAFSRIREEM